MKKTFVLLAGLVAVAYANAQDIRLQNPNLNRPGSMMEAFQNRQSIQEFDERPLSITDLSDLLWAANGINRPESGKKTAPSAQNSQDIDIYVCLPAGIYLYQAAENNLKRISMEDVRLYVERPDRPAAPCVLLLVADISRYRAGNNPEHVRDMAKVDAGIVSQNIGIFCSGAELGTRPRAQMKQEELRKALNLGEQHLLILNHPVGYPK